MRVPTNANSDLMVQRITDINSRQVRLQNEVATGQKFFSPEEDPAAFGRVMTLSKEQSELKQYASNNDYALDLNNITYSAITQIKQVSDRAGEIVTLGQGAVNAASSNAYASEVDQLIQQTLQVANSKLRNDYIFSGKSLDVQPYSLDTSVTPNVCTYNGDASQVDVPVSATAIVNPGTSGTQNSQIAGFINNLIALRDALKAGDTTSLASTVRVNLEDSENKLVDMVSSQGAVQMRINLSKTQNSERSDNITSLISKEVDLDMPTAITELNQTTLAYQAALSSTSQILKVSLLDYLK
jgi:flagellar hook-associated protein 3 FlgL